jgi:glyoxylase-like metal-dependent hydrolase (beta-lactamase superfamily II)
MSDLLRWQRISDHLYRFENICNVYALIANSEAVLIDFGSGAVLDHLGEIGVRQVRAILHTHHRDQAQGDLRAVAEGIPIFVPEQERRLFDRAELFWATRSETA